MIIKSKRGKMINLKSVQEVSMVGQKIHIDSTYYLWAFKTHLPDNEAQY